MKRKIVNTKFSREAYIYLYMKYCKLFHKKIMREYTAIFKYGNKIDYFINATGFNKRDCIEKVRDIVYYSDFFDGVKDKKDIQVIVIENKEEANE